MPSTSRSTHGKGVSPSTSTARFIIPFMLSKKAMCHSTWDLGGSALQLRPDATVRWRGVAVLHGLVVDWNFSPRTQACSEPEIIIAGGGTTRSKTNIWTALATRLNVTVSADNWIVGKSARRNCKGQRQREAVPRQVYRRHPLHAGHSRSTTRTRLCLSERRHAADSTNVHSG